MSLKRLRRRVSDPLIGLAAHGLVLLVGCLPYRCLWPLAGAVSFVASPLLRSTRRLVLANVHVAFPDWSEERRRSFFPTFVRHSVQTVLEFMWFMRRPAELGRRVQVDAAEAREYFETASSGQPVILMTPHLGNWELMGQVTAAHAENVHAVAHQLRNPWIAGIVGRARAFHGLTVILAEGAARGMLKALRAGKPVGTLLDQNTRPSQGGVFVEFFGVPAATTRAPAALARKVGARAVTAACVRENGQLRVCAARLPRPVSAYADDVALTQAMLSANEELIRRYPEQYAWTYKRWRYIPAGVHDDVRSRFPDYAREWDRGGG